MSEREERGCQAGLPEGARVRTNEAPARRAAAASASSPPLAARPRPLPALLAAQPAELE